MTLEAAVLSFYLLFPVVTDGQRYIEHKFVRESLSERQKIQQIAKLKDFLAGKHYIDDSSLVINANIPLLMNEIGLGAEELLHKKDDEKIRLLEFGVEKFSVEQNCFSGKNVVNVNNRQFLQTSYDDYYRVIEKTLWLNGEKSSDVKLLQRTVYNYDDDGTVPATVSHEYISKNKIEQISYNKFGNPVRIHSYTIKDGKRILTNRQSFLYDSSQRIISEETNSYTINAPSSKTVYTYTKKSKEPDTKYYEGGILRISTTYESNDRYRITTYFDNRYSITVTYQDKKRIKEVVYLNGVRQRERTFDE